MTYNKINIIAVKVAANKVVVQILASVSLLLMPAIGYSASSGNVEFNLNLLQQLSHDNQIGVANNRIFNGLDTNVNFFFNEDESHAFSLGFRGSADYYTISGRPETNDGNLRIADTYLGLNFGYRYYFPFGLYLGAGVMPMTLYRGSERFEYEYTEIRDIYDEESRDLFCALWATIYFIVSFGVRQECREKIGENYHGETRTNALESEFRGIATPITIGYAHTFDYSGFLLGVNLVHLPANELNIVGERTDFTGRSSVNNLESTSISLTLGFIW